MRCSSAASSMLRKWFRVLFWLLSFLSVQGLNRISASHRHPITLRVKFDTSETKLFERILATELITGGTYELSVFPNPGTPPEVIPGFEIRGPGYPDTSETVSNFCEWIHSFPSPRPLSWARQKSPYRLTKKFEATATQLDFTVVVFAARIGVQQINGFSVSVLLRQIESTFPPPQPTTAFISEHVAPKSTKTSSQGVAALSQIPLSNDRQQHVYNRFARALSENVKNEGGHYSRGSENEVRISGTPDSLKAVKDAHSEKISNSEKPTAANVATIDMQFTVPDVAPRPAQLDVQSTSYELNVTSAVPDSEGLLRRMNPSDINSCHLLETLYSPMRILQQLVKDGQVTFLTPTGLTAAQPHSSPYIEFVPASLTMQRNPQRQRVDLIPDEAIQQALQLGANRGVLYSYALPLLPQLIEVLVKEPRIRGGGHNVLLKKFGADITVSILTDSGVLNGFSSSFIGIGDATTGLPDIRPMTFSPHVFRLTAVDRLMHLPKPQSPQPLSHTEITVSPAKNLHLYFLNFGEGPPDQHLSLEISATLHAFDDVTLKKTLGDQENPSVASLVLKVSSICCIALLIVTLFGSAVFYVAEPHLFIAYLRKVPFLKSTVWWHKLICFLEGRPMPCATADNAENAGLVVPAEGSSGPSSDIVPECQLTTLLKSSVEPFQEPQQY